MVDWPRFGRASPRSGTLEIARLEGPWDSSLSKGLDDDKTTVVWLSRIERYDSSVRRNSKNLGSRRVGLVQRSGRLGLGLAADALGFGLGLSQGRVAHPVRLAGDRQVLGFALGPQLGGDLSPLAANQVENGRPDLDRVVEPSQSDVQHLDAQLVASQGSDRGW